MIATAMPNERACGRCNASYDEDAWRGLEPCGALTSSEVRAQVTAWPAEVAIDLRRGRLCLAVLARTRRTAEA